MSSTDYIIRKPNHLLRGLILVSLGIHTLLLMYLSGIYRPNVMKYIELTLKEDKKSSGRAIPRPPQLPEEESKKQSKAKIVQMEPAVLGDVSEVSIGSSFGSFTPGEIGGRGMSKKEDYYEMIKLIVEKNNIYPKEAKEKQRQGIVAIYFVINLDGTVRDFKVVKLCPFEELNEQALRAFRKSVPFPKPPPHLFKEDVPISLDVTFALY